MKDLLVFLSSKEAIIVYFVAALACFLCVVIYYVEKNNVRLKQKHNTRELNRLVSQIKEETQDDEIDSISYEKPVLEQIPESIEPIVVEEKVVSDSNTPLVEELVQEVYSQPDAFAKEEAMVADDNPSEVVISDNIINIDQLPVENAHDEEIQYTTIEPSVSEAQEELKKLTGELKSQAEVQPENIELTNFEEEQEENAIISLEELVSKSKNLYEKNELSQYADEGDEPISLQELEKKVGSQATSYTDTFVIENVIPEEDKKEVERTILEENSVQVTRKNTQQVVVENASVNKKFKSSPIISPIYGIEEESKNESDLELENTANYEKLDAEIKKTTEFLMTLKELQKRLD